MDPNAGAAADPNEAAVDPNADLPIDPPKAELVVDDAA